VPNPPSISTRAASVYQGGRYASENPTQTTTKLPGATPIPRQISTPQIGTARVAGRGTVYGGQTGQPTSPLPTDPPTDSSGSFIFPRQPAARFPIEPTKPRWRSVLITALSVAAFIAAVGGVAYFLAGDFLTALFHTIMRIA
jgi:hypothetical protein